MRSRLGLNSPPPRDPDDDGGNSIEAQSIRCEYEMRRVAAARVAARAKRGEQSIPAVMTGKPPNADR